jgi:cell division protein FtsN
MVVGVLFGPVAAEQHVAAAAPGAKSKSSADKSDKTDTASAEASIAAAVSALESGKADSAVQQLSTVISGGKLPTVQMARALYYRGIAYRKQAKPAQAIADFTSALWIKNGLEPTQRNDALLQRAGAYREAGLADQAEADEKRVAASAKGGSSSGGRSAQAASPEPAESSSQSSFGFGNFFGSLFGGSSPSSSDQTASTAPPSGDWDTSANHAARSGGGSESRASRATAVSSWTTGSTVTASAGKATAEKASVRKVTATRDGSYVQVATVRSRDQAQAVAARLSHLTASDLKGHSAEIDETVMGNMGTLYRVRLGPFASASQANQACPHLRKAGLDCLVIDK